MPGGLWSGAFAVATLVPRRFMAGIPRRGIDVTLVQPSTSVRFDPLGGGFAAGSAAMSHPVLSVASL